MDKQSNSTLESESVAAVAMLNNALAGRNRSASDVSRFRLSSVQLRNHEVGYFDPLLWAVRVMICVATFCIGGKCSVVLCLKNRKYGGVSSLSEMNSANRPNKKLLWLAPEREEAHADHSPSRRPGRRRQRGRGGRRRRGRNGPSPPSLVSPPRTPRRCHHCPPDEQTVRTTLIQSENIITVDI